MMTRHYSHLFSCLYDQAEPVGRLGRGTHYSVFRTTQWRSIQGARLDQARIHDFAVIWDEDHDERVIKVAQRLHLAGLLWPVVFIGERKGVVTLLLDWAAGPNVFVDEATCIAEMRDIASNADDHDEWLVEIGIYQRPTSDDDGARTDPNGIIADTRQRVIPYLQAIDVLWLLGDRESAFWAKDD